MFKKLLLVYFVSLGGFFSGTITSQVLANSPPVVSDVNASQRTDCSKKVDVYYDLSDADGDNCTVWVEVSDNGGVTWDVNAITFTGDIGESITPGTGKHIIWDSNQDLPGAYGTNYKVRVFADDNQYEDPSADAWVEYFHPDNHYGTIYFCQAPFFQYCPPAHIMPWLGRAFIRRPSGDILHIYVTYHGWDAFSLEVWGVSQDWRESEITWNNQPPLVEKVATFTGADFYSEGWHELNIGHDYDSYCLKVGNESSSCIISGITFVSREGTVGYRPYWTQE